MAESFLFLFQSDGICLLMAISDSSCSQLFSGVAAFTSPLFVTVFYYTCLLFLFSKSSHLFLPSLVPTKSLLSYFLPPISKPIIFLWKKTWWLALSLHCRCTIHFSPL